LKYLVAIAEGVQHALGVLYSFAEASLANNLIRLPIACQAGNRHQYL
jgi:hypothetical protein